MTTPAETLIDIIFKYVRANGKYGARPRSEFGRDEWTLDGVKVGLEDGGYTSLVITEEVMVYQTADKPAHFQRGSEEDLLQVATKLGIPS